MADCRFVAVMFRKITVSVEILTDNAKRNYLDTRLEDDRKKKVRYEALDKKRKDMVDALVAREEEAKKSRTDQAKRRKEQAEEEEIKEAGRRMLEEAQRRAAATATAASASAAQPTGGPSRMPRPSGQDNDAQVYSNGHHGNERPGKARATPEIKADDLTLILTFQPDSELAFSSSRLEHTMRSRYGPIAHLIIKDPSDGNAVAEGGKKKKPKGKRAVVEFALGNWGGCWACWKDHATVVGEDATPAKPAGKQLEKGVKARWLGGETPKWVDWASELNGSLPSDTIMSDPLKPGGHSSTNGTSTGHQNGHHHGSNGHRAPLTTEPTFSTAPDFGGTTMADLLKQHNMGRQEAREKKAKDDEFESMTLLRMRQKERERLAEQIRQEEDEEG